VEPNRGKNPREFSQRCAVKNKINQILVSWCFFKVSAIPLVSS
jgi:hypothetical protein